MGPVVRFEGVSKRFGPVQALQKVSFEARPGEIHAVVGENGAGKSTLMGVLGGYVRADSGLVVFDGTDLEKPPVAMVHQHFMLVPEFTVEDNLALAAAHSAGPVIRRRDLARKALEIGKGLGWVFDPTVKTKTLSVGQQQRLEILKALATGAETLVLDEPTAVLREEEVEELFRVLRTLKAEGRTVLLVAHKLKEVLAIADRIAVLRQGALVADVPRVEADAEKLAEWMLGERPANLERVAANTGQVRLTAEGLVVHGDRGEVRVHGVSFEVRSGEVLGISGVEGNGQVELAEAIAGVRPYHRGRMESGRGQVGYVPPDRHRDGLALDMTVEENLLIVGHRRQSLRLGPFLAPRRVREWSEGLKTRFRIAAASVAVQARTLSGGNQQKVVVGRSLDAEPNVLVAVNPTRGLDVRASAFVRDQIRAAAQAGAAVVLFSTDREELDETADRQQFMSRGRLFESEASALEGDAP